MKPVQIFVVLLLLSNLVYGQNALYFDAYRVSIPEVDGIFWIRKSVPLVPINIFIGLAVCIKSNLAEAHSVSYSEVRSVTKIAGTYMSIIKTDSLFYVYSNLDTCYVVKGQKIRKGDVLGNIGKNDEEQVELTFQVWKSGKNGRQIELDPKPFLHAIKIPEPNSNGVTPQRKVAD